MKVRVLFFAQLKDIFGESERLVDIQDGMTAAELWQLLISGLNGNGWQSLPLRYAVNENFEDGRKQLQDDDVLALIPPVGGG